MRTPIRVLGRRAAGRRRRRRRERGYTLIEVMMAVGVMTVGAVGIMSLQQATTRGNRYARQMSVATDVTRSWVERLRRDSLMWNQQGLAGVAGTDYLSLIGTDPAAAAWVAPPMTDHRAHDWQGGMTEGGSGDEAIVYCTELKLQWIMGNQGIRADVRTWWHKATPALEATASDGRILAGCGTPDEVTTELLSSPRRIHSVQASTILRRTPLP